jgi:hypothetical protein
MTFGALTAAVGNITSAASGAIDGLLKDFNEAVPTLKALGFSVTAMKMGMGVPPEVEVSLRGSLDAINPAKLKSLIEAHQGNTVLVSSLKALETAHNMKALLGDLMFKGIEAKIKLGLLPKIEIEFLS